MNKIIEDYKKIVAGNEAGKNICFISRGEYADPEIAYNGILMNYWDVRGMAVGSGAGSRRAMDASCGGAGIFLWIDRG